MASVTSIIDDVAAAALADAGGRDPEAYATLLQCIQKLVLAAETPLETAKRLLYQVSSLYDSQRNNVADITFITATYQYCYPLSRRVRIVRSREY